MTVETVAELFTRDDRSDRPALEDATGRDYDAHWLRTNAWKAGNFLRHSGVRNGVTVGIAGSGPIALLSFFGTALLEGRTRFDPPVSTGRETDGDSDAHPAYRAIVAPVERIDDYRVPPETHRVGYGGDADDPSVHDLETGLWSENPSFPPIDIDPETPLLTDGDRSVSHAEVIRCGRAIADTYEFESGDRVVVRIPFSDPRTVVAGVIATLLTEGVCVISREVAGVDEPQSEESESDGRGTYAITTRGRNSIPEPRRIDLEAVPL